MLLNVEARGFAKKFAALPADDKDGKSGCTEERPCEADSLITGYRFRGLKSGLSRATAADSAPTSK
jgi:hypothetical protein